MPDAAPMSCEYATLPANANATGPLTAAPIMAGAAEGYIDMPVGTALGAYTARANFLGGAKTVDIRRVEQPGQFNASVGIETPPRARAVAITAGNEKIVIVKAELALAYDGITYDVAKNLGPDYAGKVLFETSHSHSEFAQYTADSKLALGLGKFRRKNYDAVVAKLTEVAQAAIAAQVPAKIGIAEDPDFDPANLITHDRRSENDAISGGSRKDNKLFVIRVDAADGSPIAVLPVFGIHGTILDSDNELASSDSSGAIERAVEESFDSKVVVIHLQGAAGDVSPGGSGSVDCSMNASDDPCYDFARVESIGVLALAPITNVWTMAGLNMKDSIELEMLTRPIVLGPDPATFTVRSGALSYKQPWDGVTVPDGTIWEADGTTIVSPIDEFNAPAGAGLCGDPKMYALFPNAELPGSENTAECFGPAGNQACPYKSCIRIEASLGPLDNLFKVGFEPPPLCASTRTVVSAIRLGDYVMSILPGEPLTLYADEIRAHSPMDADHTIVVGYANGHIGYLLTPEDWLQGGYEPSINLWGPLEGQYIAEQSEKVLALAGMSTRMDAAADGSTYWVTPQGHDDEVPPPDPAPMAGMVPATIPADLYVRGHVQLTQAQPATTVPRLTSAYFVWIGEDPEAGTPRATLQRESPAGSGTFVDVERRSGRPVVDRDFLMTWTPIPLRRTNMDPRTHYWTIEWEAAMPEGAAGTTLDDMPGVPLGKYRFHVVGTGYTLDSDAFTVTPGTITVGAAHGAGTTINITMQVQAANGYRLMDLAQPANHLIDEKKSGPYDLVFTLTGGATQMVSGATIPAPGAGISIDLGAMAASVTSVQVTDPFGNTGSAPVM
jgi:neutral ceramidase